MDGTEDYYGLLGAAKGASAEELKASYRKKLLTCHPDKCVASMYGDSEAMRAEFDRVQAAYAVLSDRGRRSEFDRLVHMRDNLAMNAERVPLTDLAFDEENGAYSRGCRCGGEYVLYEEECDKEDGLPLLIQCTGCSIHITVHADAT